MQECDKENSPVPPPVNINHCSNVVVNWFRHNSFRGSKLGLNNGNSSFSSIDNTQCEFGGKGRVLAMFRELKSQDDELRRSRRCFVPLLKNRAIKITIRYAAGEEQCGIYRNAKKNWEPDEIHVINVDDDGTVDIMIVYENGNVQLQVFRKEMESFTFFSKYDNSQLLVKKQDGVEVKVTPGFDKSFHRKNEDGKDRLLFLKGHHGTDAEMIGKWLENNHGFEKMFLSSDYNPTVENHVEEILARKRIIGKRLNNNRGFDEACLSNDYKPTVRKHTEEEVRSLARNRMIGKPSINNRGFDEALLSNDDKPIVGKHVEKVVYLVARKNFVGLRLSYDEYDAFAAADQFDDEQVFDYANQFDVQYELDVEQLDYADQFDDENAFDDADQFERDEGNYSVDEIGELNEFDDAFPHDDADQFNDEVQIDDEDTVYSADQFDDHYESDAKDAFDYADQFDDENAFDYADQFNDEYEFDN